MPELHDLTVLEQGAAIRAGEISALELTEHYLERSERLGPQVGAFAQLLPELAREQAIAADESLRAGDRVGPLHGVVVPIKDLNGVVGVRTGYGTTVPTPTPVVDDNVVAALRAAGAVFTGKTNTPEFGLPCYTENEVGPPARTPWDLDRSAGGSSGGAAAAVAAGLAPVAHGNDGGGSIRIPASCCGLVGIKPSRFRVSNGPLPDGIGELGVQGTLSRTVSDGAALLDAMCQQFPDDAVRLAPADFLAAASRDPGRLRIGRYREPVIIDAEVADDCVAAYEAASNLLDRLGHGVEDVDPPFPRSVLPHFEMLWATGVASIPIPADSVSQVRPLTRWLRDRGAALSGREVAGALGTIRTMARGALRATAAYDVILTPTLARPPVPVGALRDDADPAGDFYAQCRFTPFTSPYNVTGQPAISLPIHWTPAGLPVGVQLVGRPGAEATLISLAATIETAAPWAHRKPEIW